jgi:hypothetical protein
MGFKNWLNKQSPVDLRSDFDEVAEAQADEEERGTIYRKGNIVQVWWTHDVLGRPFDRPTPETWTLPDEDQAIRAFTDRSV